MALVCKKCKKSTRNKKPRNTPKPPRCRGCGSYHFSEFYGNHFDFEELLFPGELAYTSWPEEEFAPDETFVEESLEEIPEDEFDEPDSVYDSDDDVGSDDSGYDDD